MSQEEEIRALYQLYRPFASYRGNIDTIPQFRGHTVALDICYLPSGDPGSNVPLPTSITQGPYINVSIELYPEDLIAWARKFGLRIPKYQEQQSDCASLEFFLSAAGHGCKALLAYIGALPALGKPQRRSLEGGDLEVLHHIHRQLRP